MVSSLKQSNQINTPEEAVLHTAANIQRAGITIAILTIAAKLVGLLRLHLLASYFGAGDKLDVYYTAFRIPDTIYNLLILGTLSAAFIPIFGQYVIQDKKRAYQIANTVLYLSSLTMLVLVGILFVFIKPLTHLLVPGFHGDKLQQTITLTRLLLVSPILFTISNIFSSILITFRKFVVVNLAPIFYNLGIIVGIIFLYPHMGLVGIALGVILGSVMHVLVQIPETLRQGYRFSLRLALHDSAIKKIVTLFIPRIFGLDSSYISLVIASVIGSTLASGSIAVFNLANDLQAVPLGVFAISIAVASFPEFTESYAKRDHTHFVETLGFTIKQILFFIIPLSILTLILRAYIVRLSLGRGEFNWNNTVDTFNTLGVFAFSLFAQALTPLLARAFYSRHNTKLPVIVGLMTMFINAVVSHYCSLRYGVIGVALGFSIASIFNCIILFLLMRIDLRKDAPAAVMQLDETLFKTITKFIIASLGMGTTTYILLYVLAPFVNTHTSLGILLQSGLATIGGAGAFLLIGLLLNISEAKHLLSQLKRLIGYLKITSVST